jgi:hypothetical protein
MKTMNGRSYQKSILSLSLTKKQALILEIVLLIMTGVLISTLRAYLRLPLNIPGRQGIIVMALLVSARILSKQSFASSITMIAASAMMLFPFMGFKDPALPLIYILIGVSLDFLWRTFKLDSKSIFIGALIGGSVYMLIPLIRLGIHTSSLYIVSSFIKHGFVIPIAYHFFFGVLGTIGAMGIIKSLKRKNIS